MLDTAVSSIEQLREIAFENAQNLSEDHKKRLEFEFSQLEVQGAEQRWINHYNNGDRFDKNPKNLVLPFVLGLLIDPKDPLEQRSDEMLLSSHYTDVMTYISKHGKLPSDMFRDADVPDVDIDCLPDIRDELKDYATKRFSNSENLEDIAVCSVGTWQTYKFSSALADAGEATGQAYRGVVQKITTALPADIDEIGPGGTSKCAGSVIVDGKEVECGTEHPFSKCPRCGSAETEKMTVGQALEQYTELSEFATRHPRVLAYALRMIGRFRNTGKHAGALIVSDGPLFGHLPMLFNNDQWISFLSEGQNQELSKWGWIKYDVLGLKTIGYIYHACLAIQRNRNILFGEPQPIEGRNEQFMLDGIEFNDPEERIAGYYIKDGVKHFISLDDPESIALANEGKMNSVFQFDTPLAGRILKNGSKRFEDLMIYNAMGHPGPLQCVAPYTKISTRIGDVEIIDLLNSSNKPDLLFFDSDFKESYTSDYDVFQTGVQDVYRVELEDGTTVDVTDNERFLTEDGYKELRNLKEGDEIYTV